jgi:hypothetical protein
MSSNKSSELFYSTEISHNVAQFKITIKVCVNNGKDMEINI